MFKIGQRVVFVDTKLLARHPLIVYPQLNEVVTINDIVLTSDGILIVTLKEYPRPIEGQINGIRAICFRPIDKTFAENTLERLMKEIEETEEINKN